MEQKQPTIRQITLEPADNQRLANLCGQYNENIRQIEKRLGVAILSRGNRFRIEGRERQVEQALWVLNDLFKKASKPIPPEDVHLSLQNADLEAKEEVERVLLKTRRLIVEPRGRHQTQYVKRIFEHDINFGIGPAGTGKTYLAVACAVVALDEGQVERLILTRPAVEAGERLGFLPGDLAQKVDPYLRPLYDALYEMLGFERVTKFMERNVIEIAPLAFMRGRAQPLWAKVLTPSGWRPIGELRPGDWIIGLAGKPIPVWAIHPQGKKKIYRIATQDGGITYTTEDHLWTVLTPEDKRRGREPRLVTTWEMVGRLFRGHVHRFELPLPKAVHFPKQKVPIDPYTLGLLLGDGCLTGKTTPSFSTADRELVEALEASLEGVSVRYRGGYNHVLTTERRGRSTKPVTTALRRLELLGTYSHTKFIPEEYLWNDVETRLALLQGLLDSDGTVKLQAGRRARIQFTTSSSELCRDVVFLVRSLGGIASVRTRIKESKKAGRVRGRPVEHRHDSYVIEIRLPEGMKPFRLRRKLELYEQAGGIRPIRFIHDIALAGEDEAVCITVGSPDGLYITDDFIVTHNTLNNAFIILDEAQNTTPEQLKMFLTRIGFGSKTVITGDLTQVDLPKGKLSGLRHAMEVLKGIEGISWTFFDSSDVVRHPLVQKVVLAYEAYEQMQRWE